ncbi:hypothetical protein [Bacillus alkalicellulosilyticus]|uniref:hypothetical protein n=1 Tax=Alkalihalobacterium alkalicellulosilyticum TaxID=1912214 RepID=UPI000998DF1D|nr:hypothetical protein [Bacillus alkalicellulosilyticus]
MKVTKKLKLLIVSYLFSVFSCYSLFKMYESMVLFLGDSNPEIDNVGAVALAMVFAPILLFFFSSIFYLFVYLYSVKKFPNQLFSWRIFLLEKKTIGLNAIRILILILLWFFMDSMREEIVPMWAFFTVAFNIVLNGFWVLQMVAERQRES